MIGTMSAERNFLQVKHFCLKVSNEMGGLKKLPVFWLEVTKAMMVIFVMGFTTEPIQQNFEQLLKPIGSPCHT